MATLCRWSRVAKRREAWFESGFGQSINQNRNKLNICNGHQSVYGDGKHGNAYDDDDGDDDDDDESHLLLSSVKHSIDNIILNGRPQYCHNDDLGRLVLVAKLI